MGAARLQAALDQRERAQFLDDADVRDGVLSLAGRAAAAAAAYYFYPLVVPYLTPHYIQKELIAQVVAAALVFLATLIVVSLLFSAMVQERWREVGLLRAMGAKPNQIMTVILGEAAIITGLGGVAGLVLGTALLLVFARSLGFYFGLLGVSFAWPPLAVLEGAAITAIVFSAILGLVGAFLPAWRVRRMAPYALIQDEAH